MKKSNFLEIVCLPRGLAIPMPVDGTQRTQEVLEVARFAGVAVERQTLQQIEQLKIPPDFVLELLLVLADDPIGYGNPRRACSVRCDARAAP